MALVAEEGLAEFGFGICQHAGLAKLHCHVVERIDTLLGVIRLRASEYVVAAGHLELSPLPACGSLWVGRGDGAGQVSRVQ